MIKAAHALIYSDDPVATRAFFRDVFGFPTVDAGDGWLIFKLPPAELGVHPTDGGPMTADTMRLSFLCDELDSTVADLVAAGATVASPPISAGFGVIVTLNVPGGVTIDVYQPRHATAFDLAE